MKARIGILLLHFAVFYTLMFAYEYFVVPRYEYQGFSFQPDEANLYIVLLCVAVLSLITPVSAEKPSTLFNHMTLVLVLMPILVMFHAAREPWEFAAAAMIGYAITVALPPFLKIRPPRFSLLSMHELRRILFIATFVYLAVLFMFGGAQYMNFDFSKVYEFREDAAHNLPGIFGYISPMVGKVVVPIGFVLSLLFRKYLAALTLLGCTVLIFGMTAHKSTLFAPFLILLIYGVSLSKNLIFRFNMAILVTLLAALGDFWLQQNYAPEVFGTTSALTLERVFFIPAYLNYRYYEFFSKNDFVLFSNSKLTLGLLDYPYPLDVPYLIGREYFDNEKMSANTGWIGSGYMQAGLVGIILYAVVVAAVFKYIDACARDSGERALITASVVVPISALATSSDLPTIFVTHGLYVNLLLIACLHREDPSYAYRSPQQRSFA
jgi:hypothetical protein